MNCFCIVPFTISTRPENICKILPETQSGKCLHNLGPPLLDYIAGPSNKMCPGPGITLGLIIQNCHKAIATQKRMIYLPNFLSRALLQVAAVTEDCRPADELQHLGLWSDTVIHHSRHQASCSPGALATLTPYNATPWLLSLLVSLQTIFTRSASTQFKPNQDHDINLRRNKSRLIVICETLLGRKATTTQWRETRDNVSWFFKRSAVKL